MREQFQAEVEELVCGLQFYVPSEDPSAESPQSDSVSHGHTTILTILPRTFLSFIHDMIYGGHFCRLSIDSSPSAIRNRQ